MTHSTPMLFLTVLASAAAGCGGSDMTIASPCGVGVTVHALPATATTYTTTSVTQLQETCGLGLTPDLVMTDRSLTYDANAKILTLNAANGSPMGSGTPSCNVATLTQSDVLNDGTCEYSRALTVKWTSTGDTTFQIAFQETHSNFKSVAGMNCTPPAGATCTISFNAQLAKKN